MQSDIAEQVAAMKPGFFDRTQKLFTMGDVNAKLAERTGQSARDGISVERAASVTEQHPVSVPFNSTEPSQNTGIPSVLTERPPVVLRWMAPVKNPNGSSHICAGGTDYQIRKTTLKEVPTYWAWHDKKLLGYSGDLAAAKILCTDHINGVRS